MGNKIITGAKKNTKCARNLKGAPTMQTLERRATDKDSLKIKKKYK